MGITRNAADAEEVVQDAFWSVTRKIDSFRGEAAFGSWVYRIVANAAYQKLRRRANELTGISLVELLSSPQGDGRHGMRMFDWSARTDDPSVQTELRAALSSAISELPPQYRAVVFLRDAEGLSVAEVAESLGMSVVNVKSRAHRARLFLRKRLSAFMSTTGRRTHARTIRSVQSDTPAPSK